MVSDIIPDDVRRFVLTSISSVPHLEALLLLRASPEPWPLTRVAQRLYISDKAAEKLLADLCASGMLVCDADTYRYAPETALMQETVDNVARAYSQNLVAMTNLIHSSVERKAHQFADAFNLRKKS
jgi:DNA-binding IclR family transcriptional regulator